MSREAQVRFREDVGVKVPCVTRFGCLCLCLCVQSHLYLFFILFITTPIVNANSKQIA